MEFLDLFNAAIAEEKVFYSNVLDEMRLVETAQANRRNAIAQNANVFKENAGYRSVLRILRVRSLNDFNHGEIRTKLRVRVRVVLLIVGELVNRRRNDVVDFYADIVEDDVGNLQTECRESPARASPRQSP